MDPIDPVDCRGIHRSAETSTRDSTVYFLAVGCRTLAASSWQYDIVVGYLDPVLNTTAPPPGQPGLHRQCQWFNREKIDPVDCRGIHILAETSTRDLAVFIIVTSWLLCRSMAVSSWQYDTVPGYLNPVLNATTPPPGQPGLHRQCQWFNREKIDPVDCRGIHILAETSTRDLAVTS
jgi:hypothetical protein